MFIDFKYLSIGRINIQVLMRKLMIIPQGCIY